MSTPATPNTEQRREEERAAHEAGAPAEPPMPSGEAGQKIVVVDQHSPTLELASWPLRDEPIVSMIVLVILAMLSIGMGTIAGSPWWGVAAGTVLFVSLWRMWVPVHYRLCELGLIQSTLRRSWRIPWHAIAGYEVRHNGILILPEDDDSLISRLKGIYLPWGESKDELTAIVGYYFGLETSADDDD